MRARAMGLVLWIVVLAPLPAMGQWEAGAPMLHPRTLHTATLLPNGEVLVAGGHDGTDPVASCELYDPRKNEWREAAAMSVARHGHTATLMPSGMVLVTGGSGGGVELYDPASGTWSVREDFYGSERMDHTATLLPSGQLLVMGGYEPYVYDPWDYGDAMTYDESTNVWTDIEGGMTERRFAHSATLIAGAAVLVVGGFAYSSGELASAEMLFLDTMEFLPVPVEMPSNRWMHRAMVGPSGRVAVFGGERDSDPTAEVLQFDPGAPDAPWSVAATLHAARVFHTATDLGDARVLLAAGSYGGGDDELLASTEIYDHATRTLTDGPSLATARDDHTAVLFFDGRVLVAGGSVSYDGPPTASTELTRFSDQGSCLVCPGDGSCARAAAGVACGKCATCDAQGACKPSDCSSGGPGNDSDNGGGGAGGDDGNSKRWCSYAATGGSGAAWLLLAAVALIPRRRTRP